MKMVQSLCMMALVVVNHHHLIMKVLAFYSNFEGLYCMLMGASLVQDTSILYSCS